MDVPEESESSKSRRDGQQHVDNFSKEFFQKIVTATKAFQGLPSAGPSWDLQKSYPQFSKAMKQNRLQLLSMMTDVMKHMNLKMGADIKRRDDEDKFEYLVDVNDEILERIIEALDDAEGLFKKSEIVVVNKVSSVLAMQQKKSNKRKAEDPETFSSVSPASTKISSIDGRPMKKALYRHKVMEKPQLKFSQPVDNSSSAFVPKLKEKPNSIKPLSILPEYNEKNEEYYGHPYQVELTRWSPNDSLLEKVEPQNPGVLEKTPLVFVSTSDDLRNMMKDLSQANEIAVDLEHHSFRTFLGITCLIQISTRNKDFIVDAFTLRDELSELNHVFTDPKIVKVFHGAMSDIEWLQKDFGVYVVNMFDTSIAAKVLGLPKHSLQFLLNLYCDFVQDKALQLADWRIRPLPQEMVEYARQDTHFLLYLYDVMKNQLLDSGNQFANLLVSVFDQSKALCEKRYEKPVNNPQLALRKTGRHLNNRQLFAFTEIYKWRDSTAREKDESLGYVLPSHMLLMIAESLPKEMSGILACCDPVPPLLQSNLGIIHRIVTTARNMPLHEEKTQLVKVEKKEKLKDWVLLMNSINDVSLSDIAKIPMSDFSPDSTWPQPWTNKHDANDVKVHHVSSIKFNANKSKVEVSKTKVISTPTPFDRYTITKEIVEMLKDPAKKDTLDLNDPLIKAVNETLVQEADDLHKPETAQPVVKNLAALLPEKEFVPFNPLANILKKEGKKKKKKIKNEPWDDNLTKTEPLDVEDGECSSDEDSESDNESYDSNEEKSEEVLGSFKMSKKKKGFMNKLKHTFKKGYGTVEMTDIKSEISEETSGTYRKRKSNEVTNSKQPEVQMTSKKSRTDAQSQQDKHVAGSSNRKKNFTDNKRDKKNKDEKRGKKKFFNFGKREGKSITYK